MKKILIAEDDKFLASAYRVKLTKAGFEVHIAQDGQEALLALQTFMPDLILLDLIMPVKDGFTTLQELKANSSWKNIPVIVASNLGQKEDVEKSKQLGALDFVIKSDLSLDAVIAKINAVLGGGAQQATQNSSMPSPQQQPTIATFPQPQTSSQSAQPTPVSTVNPPPSQSKPEASS